MDRASRYLTEGRFESAIRLLEKTENVFPNCKNLPELMAVTQVCYAATWRACHCNRSYTRKLPDWYHVLKVDERADFDAVKKRYRQLALLLHPDKNKHPNSEAAFKIITEAYACLSDKGKRDLFNLERRRTFCSICNLKAQMHATSHTSRPVITVRTPQTPKFNTKFASRMNWESENLQNLRERAKTTSNNLERDWGSKTSKWIHQLASARHKYWNPSGSPLKCDPRTPGQGQDYAPRSKLPRSPMSPVHPTPRSTPDCRRNSNAFEVRRSSTSDVNNERTDKLEDSLDLLLKRLRVENSAAAKETPLMGEFCVHTRTPEAGHLLRPLGARREMRSSWVDQKCSVNLDAGPGYAMCLPKGRCLTKKDPFSPSVAGKHPTVHVDRAFRSTSVLGKKDNSTPKPVSQSSEVEFSTPGQSSSLRFEKLHQSTKEDSIPTRSGSVSRTASESWTSRVKANPELFDDVFTTVSSSTFRTPSRRQSSFVLRTPPTDPSTEAPSTAASLEKFGLSKMSDRKQKVAQKGSAPTSLLRNPSAEKDVDFVRACSLSNTSTAEINREVRPPLGSRNENVTHFLSKNLGTNSNICNIEKGGLEQLRDTEQQQRIEAINGILYRLSAEAKSVAETLDRRRENIAAESKNQAVVTYNGRSRSRDSHV